MMSRPPIEHEGSQQHANNSSGPSIRWPLLSGPSLHLQRYRRKGRCVQLLISAGIVCVFLLATQIHRIISLARKDLDSAPPPLLRAQQRVSASTEHLHGVLGRSANGEPAWSPKPLGTLRLTPAATEAAHKGYCFNTRISESVSLDRDAGDRRDYRCGAEAQSDLKSCSVVIVFHNENLSVLLRTVHSVLNHSDPNILQQVILFDDYSDLQTHYWLDNQLNEYIRLLPKVSLHRAQKRLGLMVARIEGISRVAADIAVLLDSHVECTKGWLEPLIKPVSLDRKVVTVPYVHSINAETFDFEGGGLAVLGFTWSLGQQAVPNRKPPSLYHPTPTPIMAGGLFAIDRSWFEEIGKYDSEMRLYGGEEMEISFKIWTCGGQLLLVPCSRVGHVFRTDKYWKGQVYPVAGHEIHRNKLRVAAVWMDEYAKLAEIAIAKLPAPNLLGDVEILKARRKKNRCSTFSWYLTNVYPELLIPPFGNASRAGAISNTHYNSCVDTLTQLRGEVGSYPCHNQHGTQAFLLTDDGKIRIAIRGFSFCLHRRHTGVVQTECEFASTWRFVGSHVTTYSERSMQTLEKPLTGSEVIQLIPGTGQVARETSQAEGGPAHGPSELANGRHSEDNSLELCLHVENIPTPKSPHSLSLKPCILEESKQIFSFPHFNDSEGS